MDNEIQRAPGYDPELHSCDQCLDEGISKITNAYCDACQLGAARARQDKFSDELQAHGFKPAMWLVFRSTQKTERAIAAAEKALLLDKLAKLEAKLMATLPRRPMPEFRQGSTYMSTEYGALVFKRVDTFYGETTYEFFWPAENMKRWIRPDDLARHFCEPLLRDK